ncbi:putative F-box protein At3g16210 [Panicum virgatum]|uniref:putative F-box protein At3g16210 n=1 Tax=Panicum virgatum TaxID=38727 RepID=UPI0019D50530|nr:putative F-box protein At3g16210 [Panicum virgatum]
MADEGFDVPTDAFVEILLRLPTSARRRFRLVCKRWRDVIDERTPERQVRTKTLAFIGPWRSPRALVFDDTDGRRSHEWAYPSAHEVVSMVGTCNGLICLLDAGEGGRSALRLTVANPVTGEALALPPLPAAWGLPGLHAFGYHPTTGRYKVVHVSSRLYHHDGAGGATSSAASSPSTGPCTGSPRAPTG